LLPLPGSVKRGFRNRRFQKSTCVLDNELIYLEGKKKEPEAPRVLAVCKEHGIHAASTALRHGSLRVSAEFYVEARRRTTSGLGHLLREPAPVMTPLGVSFKLRHVLVSPLFQLRSSLGW
jgi:hypothetical protein